MKIRCSSLPRVMRCPAAKVPPEVEFDETGLPAITGRAAHEVMAIIVREDMQDSIPHLGYTLEKYPQVDFKELQYLAWQGLRMWKRLSPGLEIISVETRLETDNMSGQTDVLGRRTASWLVVIDWKSGRRQDYDYSHQLKGYAHLARHFYEDNLLEGVIIITAWLRDMKVQTESFTLAELDIWYEEFLRVCESDAHVPGPMCEYCPRNYSCDARTVFMQSAIEIWEQKIKGLDKNDPRSLGLIYPLWKLLESFGNNQYTPALKTALRMKGELATGDGRILYFQDKSKTEIINDTMTFKIIMNHFGARTLPELLLVAPDAIKINKTNLDKAVKRQAPQRKGKETLEKFYEELKKYGLIQESKSQSLAIKKGVLGVGETKQIASGEETH